MLNDGVVVAVVVVVVLWSQCVAVMCGCRVCDITKSSALFITSPALLRFSCQSQHIVTLVLDSWVYC